MMSEEHLLIKEVLKMYECFSLAFLHHHTPVQSGQIFPQIYEKNSRVV